MKKYLRLLYYLAFISLLASCMVLKSTVPEKLTSYVDPFIGTASSDYTIAGLGGTGNVFPGAVVPWGMISPSPRNSIDVNIWGHLGDAISGYLHNEKYMYGFDQMHLSGVGCNGLGNILIVPSHKVSHNIYDHKSEYSKQKAKPGYYSVYLNDHEIKAEMTATTRTSLMRFTSENPSESLVITTDMYYNLRPAIDAEVTIVSNSEIEGYNKSGEFCGAGNQETVYFVMQFSEEAISYGTYNDTIISEGSNYSLGNKSGAYMIFSPEKNKQVMVKIGVSYVSVANARLNLGTEQQGFDFDKVYLAADRKWEDVLSRVLVEGGDERRKRIFYTAMYHALLHPNVFNDVNGEYLAMETKEVMKLTGSQKNQYTVFSLWDTYRNVHSFLSLLYPEQQLDMVRSMVNMAQSSGFLPKWEIAANETYIMVGDPAVPVVVETYLKGLTDFDIDTAYKYMLRSALDTIDNPIRPGLADYIKYGYIPFDTDVRLNGSTATSLEYYYADYAIAQLAKKLGKTNDYEKFLERSYGYKHFYDPETNFLRTKYKDGSFITPFDPLTMYGDHEEAEMGGLWASGAPGLIEGNFWQYTFMVNHDIEGLIELMGKDMFLKRLLQSFESDDRFVMTNEPPMAYPFLFNYLEGEEWRTQQMALETLDKYFTDSPGGLPGNDDAGTISCWAIFTSLGFYPVNTITGDYALSTPVFDRITLKIDSNFYPGNQFVIQTNRNSPESVFIESKLLNSRPFTPYFISHDDIVSGGKLIMVSGE